MSRFNKNGERTYRSVRKIAEDIIFENTLKTNAREKSMGKRKPERSTEVLLVTDRHLGCIGDGR